MMLYPQKYKIKLNILCTLETKFEWNKTLRENNKWESEMKTHFVDLRLTIFLGSMLPTVVASFMAHKSKVHTFLPMGSSFKFMVYMDPSSLVNFTRSSLNQKYFNRQLGYESLENNV